MTHIHGGDTESYLREYGRKPLDFSANVSPLGLPEGVKKAVCKALEQAEAYPDPLCRNLCEAIGEKEDRPPAEVICGNGAADLIFRLIPAVKPKKALLPAPTFAEYEQALELFSCEIEYFYLKEENGFSLTDEILTAINGETDILFLCQPNNPTGALCEKPLLLEILKRCRETNTVLVMDECFTDFLDEPSRFSLSDKLSEYENLFILKAFTKFYAMAGLRLGYGLCANENLLKKVRSAGQPWAVSSLAQAGGIAALKEKEYEIRLKELLKKEKAYLSKGLSDA
ncbi:MAG: aminotransferase class I/II-fold pyridoxal phosphate-dependent enzyme, partial [Clostridiales bacterium]|nr:aminotransferase class I/II-fold pyridoxal phosphate-dependent enzyme [Clostridiales bacterium]